MSQVELMAVLGGIGVGIVVGWLLPIVWFARWESVFTSAATVAIAVVAVYFLAGLSGSIAGLIGVASGAWLHAAFLEHLAARTATNKGGVT